MFKRILCIGTIIALCLPAAFAADKGPMKAYPNDFKIIAVSGGVAPWESANKIEINSDGKCAYYEMSAVDRKTGEFKKVKDFSIDSVDLNILYAAILKNDFFALEKSYIATDVREGSFAEMTVTVKGKTHTVRTQNMAVKNFDGIAHVINSVVPKENRLVYNAIL